MSMAIKEFYINIDSANKYKREVKDVNEEK